MPEPRVTPDLPESRRVDEGRTHGKYLDRIADLRATERELIRQSRQLGSTLDAVADKLRDVNGDREKAFEEREKLISTHR